MASRISSGACASAVAALLLAGAAAAHADETAKAHYDRGTAAYALGHFAEAAQEYEKSFALQPDPVLLYDAAQAYRLDGNEERALFLYRSYLRFGGAVQNRDEVERRIAELERTLRSEQEARTSPPTTTAEPATAPAHLTPRPQPTPVATSVTAPPAEAPRPRQPVYKKWWLWTAVGVVAAGAAVGLGVGLTQSGPDASAATELGTFHPSF